MPSSHRTHCLSLFALASLLSAGCASEQPEPVSGGRAALSAPKAGPILARLDEIAAHPSPRTLLVQGGWGQAAGEFGRRQQASEPGPMRIVVDDQGRLHVLDQVNSRIQVFDASGALIEQIGPVPETSEDLVVTGERIWIVAQPGPGEDRRLRLIELDRQGRRLRTHHVVEGAALLTGVFASGAPAAPDIWLELRHRHQLRVVHEGALVAETDQLAAHHHALGRPQHGTATRLAAARTGAFRATVAEAGHGLLAPRLDLASRRPLVHLLELASDERGALFVALATARGDGQPFQQQLVVLPPGQPDRPAPAPLRIDLVDGPMAADAFRPIAVGRDGAVYQLWSDPAGVKVFRWAGGDR